VGAIFDGKKSKRAEDTPAEGSKSKELRKKNKRARRERSRAARRASRDVTTTTTKLLLLTRLDGALDWPLEARECSTTC
jgi:hypothetical protein